jgi:hypothetical protein
VTGEIVVIKTSPSASLNKEMANAGLRWLLKSTAQLSKLVLDIFDQRRDRWWNRKG